MSENEDKRERLEKRMQSHRQASAKRCENFRSLLEGIYETVVNDKITLEGREYDCIERLVHGSSQGEYDYSMASGYFQAYKAFDKISLLLIMAESYHFKNKNKKIIIFEERRDALDQIRQILPQKTSFKDKDIGIYNGENQKVDTPIIICTYKSMEDMLQEVGKENIGLVLCDDAHYALSGNRQNIIQKLDNACLYGFTATPVYDENRNCDQVFGRAIKAITFSEEIVNHSLCGVKNGLLIAGIPADLTNMTDSELMKITAKAGIKEALVDYYFEGYDDNLGYIKDKTTVINVPSIKEANDLAEMMNERAGKTVAKAYHSCSSDNVLQEFNLGDFPILIQVGRLTEKYENPEVEICINYPTLSYVREAQRSIMALHNNKKKKIALVLDIAFKQHTEGNAFIEIEKNGQVLLKDIIGGIYVAPKAETIEYTPQEECKQKIGITKNDNKSSCTIITKIEELLKLNWEYEEIKKRRGNKFELTGSGSEEQKGTEGQKSSNASITKEEFVENWCLGLKKENELIIDPKQKEDLWNKLTKEDKKGLFIQIQSEYMLPEDNIPAFVSWLREQNIIVIRKKDVLDVSEKQFMRLRITQDNKRLSLKQKDTLWNELKEKGAMVKVQSDNDMIDVLPEWRIQLLRKKGILVLEVNEGISMTEFVENWRLCLKKENIIIGDPKQKEILWNTLIKEDHQGLFVKAKSRIGIIDILPEDMIPALKQLLRKKGIIVIRRKYNSDITKEVFTKWFIMKGKKAIGTNKKEILWEKLINQANSEFFIKVQSGDKVIDVLPQKNIRPLSKLLATKGIKIGIYTSRSPKHNQNQGRE